MPKPAAKKAKAPAGTRTLLIEEGGGRLFKVVIPEDWKVTFGDFQHGKYGGGGERALRTYEGESRQRAVFVGVKAFRDLSIPIERLVVSEEGTRTWKLDEDGEFLQQSVQKKKVWKDGDD